MRAEQTPNHRVLVADDDPSFRDLVAHCLERRGLRVAQARDGYEALERLHEAARSGPQSHFSAFVTDFRMPRVTGMELIELLAAVGVAPQTVLLSAFLDPSAEKWARVLGVAAVVQKPLNFDELAVLVQRVAGSRPSLHPRQPSAPSSGEAFGPRKKTP